MDINKMNSFLNYKPVFEENPLFLLDIIIEKAKKYLTQEQINGIIKAYEFSKNAHGDTKRLSGERYIVHPLKTTEILMEIKPDLATIQAALLHDVIEDTKITYEDVKNHFGKEVADLCEGLEKVSKIKYKGEERHLETLKKTFIAMAKDLRVIFIKLADRIHNIQTLEYHPKVEKRIKIANETMKIYVPIAKKLGLYNYQLYLENGSFRILNIDDFNKIFFHLQKIFGEEKKYKDKGKRIISNFLMKEGVTNFEIEGRLKSPRRIYEKMQKKYQSKDITNVMDMLAYRIIADSVSDCYMILGIIHKYHTPLIKKIKDYIAVPKFNGYRSIHTTVLGVFRFPIEIQIRTRNMDEIAKYGVAAHFEYSEKGGGTLVEESQAKRIKRIQELVGMYQSLDEKEGFKDKLNIEVLEKSTFLYTPSGDVKELPFGSTVLDFAFNIHSNIGLMFKNALVNGEIKPISYIPKTGDVVEIKIFKNKFSANKHWLEFLHTPAAKYQLNKFLKHQNKQERLETGIKALNKKLSEFNLPNYNSEKDLIKKLYSHEDFVKKILEVLDKKETFGSFIKNSYPNEWNFHYEGKNKIKSNGNKENIHSIIVDCDKHIDYVLCIECCPKYGDQILARTGKDGIKIHKLDCKAMKTISFDKLLEAHRQSDEIQTYKIFLEMEIDSRYANILHIMTIFSQMNIFVGQISVSNIDGEINKVTLEAEFSNPTKIAFILNDLKKYNDSIKILKKKILY